MSAERSPFPMASAVEVADGVKMALRRVPELTAAFFVSSDGEEVTLLADDADSVVSWSLLSAFLF